MTKVIGLTGGIASGKSTVSNFLLDKGYKLIDADLEVRKMQEKNGILYNLIKDNFDSKYFSEDGSFDRKKFSNLIFTDKPAREKLSDLQDKVIFDQILEQRNLATKDNDVVFLDIPLLFELSYENLVDEIWMVYVPKDIQIERLMARNSLSKQEALKRINSQMPIEDKRKLAHNVIDNSGSIDSTQKQVLKLLEGSD